MKKKKKVAKLAREVGEQMFDVCALLEKEGTPVYYGMSREPEQVEFISLNPDYRAGESKRFNAEDPDCILDFALDKLASKRGDE